MATIKSDTDNRSSWFTYVQPRAQGNVSLILDTPRISVLVQKFIISSLMTVALGMLINIAPL